MVLMHISTDGACPPCAAFCVIFLRKLDKADVPGMSTTVFPRGHFYFSCYICTSCVIRRKKFHSSNEFRERKERIKEKLSYGGIPEQSQLKLATEHLSCRASSKDHNSGLRPEVHNSNNLDSHLLYSIVRRKKHIFVTVFPLPAPFSLSCLSLSALCSTCTLLPLSPSQSSCPPFPSP